MTARQADPRQPPNPLMIYAIGVETPFDYAGLDGKLAADARAIVARVRDRAQAHVLDTGRDLLSIKDRLGHGVFLKWISAEFGMTPRTAQNYMQAASVLADKSEIVSHLPPTALYALSSPSVPKPVRAELLARMEGGERISAKSITSVAVAEARKASKSAGKRARREREVEHLLSELSPEEKSALDTKAKRQAAAERINDARRRQTRYDAETREVAARTAAEKAGALLAKHLSKAQAAEFLRLLATARSGFAWFDHLSDGCHQPCRGD